ncbi:hypothetical protein [Vibrio phage YC]|uniref:Uncharacterized protein n=1 Tax=Vibrio phage YC TaxID=2267403 RepID=A0A384ZS05_9CAUD|nr:hypothetical protein HWB64_gp057 [Vibrio phage YC]AXC34426.1 hypothetical protein [Vibrio phage YC]
MYAMFNNFLLGAGYTLIGVLAFLGVVFIAFMLNPKWLQRLTGQLDGPVIFPDKEYYQFSEASKEMFTADNWASVLYDRLEVVSGIPIYVVQEIHREYDGDEQIFWYTCYTPWGTTLTMRSVDNIALYVGREMILPPMGIKYTEHGSVRYIYDCGTDTEVEKLEKENE